MGPPIVYLEREPLLMMLRAAVEIYNRECYGDLLGTKPSRGRNYYHVSGIAVRQGVTRRTNAEVVTSGRANGRIHAYHEGTGRLYPLVIGDFHSHPAIHGVWRVQGLSDADVKDMKSSGGSRRPLGVIIRIARRSKKAAPWRRLDRKTRLRGSLHDFTFDLMAFHLIGEGAQRTPEALVIEIAPSVRKALNRAGKLP